MAQQYKDKQTTKTVEHEQDAPPENIQDESLTADIDAMLDEIDDVLEVNAEEFVRGYVQQGGE